MPRSPANIIPFRGPFGGLKRVPSSLIPPNRTLIDLNVLTIDGDIRRRPGVEIAAAPDWSPMTIVRVLRMMPFFYAETGGDTPTIPHLYMAVAVATGACYHVIVDLENQTLKTYYGGVMGETLGGGSPVHTFGAAIIGDAVVVRNRLGSSTRVIYKMTGNTSWSAHPFFYSAPQMSVGTTQAGTLPAGTYCYTCFWKNSTLGLIGPANLENYPTIQLVSPGGCRFTIYGSMKPSGVDTVAIYRKQQDVDTDWYFVVDTPISGDFDFADNGSHDPLDKTQANRLDTIQGFDVGDGRDVAYWRGRTWMDKLDEPNVVYYSGYREMNNFRVDQALQLGEAPDDRLVRLIPLGGILYGLKKRSIWAITGSGPESFQANEIASGLGLIGSSAVAVAHGMLFFAGQDGLYRLNGQGLEPLAEDVRELWLQFKDPSYMTMAHDPARDLIVVHGYKDTTFTNDQTLVYHIPSRQWHVWDLGGEALGQGFVTFQEQPRLLTWITGGAHDKELAALRDETDPEQRDFGTTEVPWYYTIGPTDFGTPYPKQINYLNLAWLKDPSAEGEGLFAILFLDQGTSQAKSCSVNDDTAPYRAKWPIGLLCDTFMVQVIGTTNRRLRITGVEIEAEAVGNR